MQIVGQSYCSELSVFAEWKFSGL